MLGTDSARSRAAVQERRNRRLEMKRRTVLTGFAALASGSLVRPRWAKAAAVPVKIVIPRDSIFVLNYLGAKDAGVFERHGIDLDIDARPFAGFLAGLPSKECAATTYSG